MLEQKYFLNYQQEIAEYNEQELVSDNIHFQDYPPDSINYPRIYTLKAAISLDTGKPDSALIYLKKASYYFTEDKVSAISNKLYEYYLQQGRYYNFVRDFNSSILWLDQAISNMEQAPTHDPITYARILHELAYAWFWKMDLNKAATFYGKAIMEIQTNTNSNKDILSDLQAKLALVYLELEKFEEAYVLLAEVERYIVSQQKPLSQELLDACIILGDQYFNLQDNRQQAVRFYEMASAILNIYYTKDYYKYGKLYYSLGRLEYTGDSYEKSLYYFEQTLLFSRKWPPLYEYQYLSCRWIALYYQRRQENIKAIEYDNLAIKYANHTYHSLAYTYINLGRSQKALGDTALAIKSYYKAVEVATSGKGIDNYHMLTNAHYEMGCIFRQVRNTDKALTYLLLAKESWGDDLPKGLLIASIEGEISNVYADKKDYINALRSIQKSIIALCNTFNNSSFLANPDIKDTFLHHQLMVALDKKADYLFQIYNNNFEMLYYLKESQHCMDLAIRLLERIVIDIDNNTDQLYFLNYATNYLDEAIAGAILCYNITGDLLYAERTFQYMEKSRMFAMRINLHREEVEKISGIPDSLIFRKKDLQNKIFETENNILSSINYKLPAIQIDTLRENLLGLYISYDRIIHTIEKTYSQYYRLKYEIQGKNIQQLQNSLKRDELFIEYQILDTVLIIFTSDRKQWNIIQQCVSDSLYYHLSIVRSCIDRNPIAGEMKSSFEAFVNSSRYLYDLLIKPLGSQICGKQLIIAPHNELNSIPFEVLLTRQPLENKFEFGSLNYLFKDHIVRYVFSSQWIKPEKRNKPFFGQTAIFQPHYDVKGPKPDSLLESIPVLEGAAKEAIAVKRITKGTLFNGYNANELIFKTRAVDYDILHLALHTLTDNEIPTNSRIIMTNANDYNQDGIVYAYEILQMNLKARLIVLSGCSTGHGQLQKGEGILSLARCFFYAGTETMTYTLWPTADEAGAKIMSHFYYYLKRMQKPSKALQSAKIKYLSNEDPVKLHPFYWAEYIVMGFDQRVLLSYPYFNKLVLLTILIAILYYRKGQ